MHHIGAVAGFTAKPLAEEVRDIRFVIDHKNAYAHVALLMCCGLLVAWQAHRELGEFADPAIDLDRAAVLLGHNVVADR